MYSAGPQQLAAGIRVEAFRGGGERFTPDAAPEEGPRGVYGPSGRPIHGPIRPPIRPDWTDGRVAQGAGWSRLRAAVSSGRSGRAPAAMYDVEISWRKSRAPWARQRSREELDATRSRAEVCARIQRRNLKRSILAHLLLDGLTAVGRTLPGRPGLDGRTDSAGGAGRTEGRQKSRPVHTPGRASRRLAGRAAGRGPFRPIFPRSAYVLTVVGGPKTGRGREGLPPPL